MFVDPSEAMYEAFNQNPQPASTHVYYNETSEKTEIGLIQSAAKKVAKEEDILREKLGNVVDELERCKRGEWTETETED